MEVKQSGSSLEVVVQKKEAEVLRKVGEGEG